MNYKDEKYKKLIDNIKSKKPELDTPQNLTSEILSAIEMLPKKQVPNRYLRIVSWTSSVAAVFLLGLFLSERSTPIASPSQKTYNYPLMSQINIEDVSKIDKLNEIVREKIKLRKERESFYANISTDIKTFK